MVEELGLGGDTWHNDAASSVPGPELNEIEVAQAAAEWARKLYFGLKKYDFARPKSQCSLEAAATEVPTVLARDGPPVPQRPPAVWDVPATVGEVASEQNVAKKGKKKVKGKVGRDPRVTEEIRQAELDAKRALKHALDSQEELDATMEAMILELQASMG